ncbi:MAG: hypothetical protein LKF01_05660 [Lactobacillus sp.]|nr:hypothetical protein [Lactobacillus sp.]MCH4068957.1 hypothetical protein [Lactobacillus sp.]MCI1303359.1 hypothetical protein [Lactobacillus sp.]MCI1359613.1 hypothetical protein [Lactobacillus sp.]MCI1399806.1 hypothetical protein [Lactobacillus sp.]
MDVEKVIKLLKRLDINPSEFFTYKSDEITTAIAYAYEYNEINYLKQLAIKSLKKFHANPTFITLYHSSIACSSYLDLTNKNLFNEYDTDKLIFTLSNVAIWSQSYIELFGGAIFLLPPEKLFSISQQVIISLDYIKNVSFSQFSNAMEMILNALIALIEKRKLNLAERLYSKLDETQIPEVSMLIRTRKKFYHALIIFCKSQNRKEIDTVFEILESLNMTRILKDYQFAFNKVNTIYSD